MVFSEHFTRATETNGSDGPVLFQLVDLVERLEQFGTDKPDVSSTRMKKLFAEVPALEMYKDGRVYLTFKKDVGLVMSSINLL